jgi:molybdenum cofactor biosynthesis enzyme MoaA
MLLNILLTRACNYNCLFCIEKTKENTLDDSSVLNFLKKANYLIDNSLVDDVLLLGGEPLFYRHILKIVNGLHVKPIITTNAYRLKDDNFIKQFNFTKIKAINISIPHYDENKRKKLIGAPCLSNDDLKHIISEVPIPVRINTLLMNGFIDTKTEVNKMIKFAKWIGASSIKIGELTGINRHTHDFIDESVLRFNKSHYCPIPFKEMYKKCHKFGGSHLFKKSNNFEVYFNSAPDYAISGGKDLKGKYYHIVLFNDGMMGFSWRRSDGLYKKAKDILEAAQQNQKLY